MSHKHSKAGDKQDSYWASIQKEKLDTLRWVLLHSGINVAKLQNDDGQTGLQVAAANDRHKSLLVMLDLFRQKRELEEAIDVDDDEGRTPLMLAAAAGHVKCVEHLLYYKASVTRKSAEGLTARDYAVKNKRTEAVAAFDEEAAALKEAAAGGSSGGVEEAVDADGLTSTQRSRLKRKQLKDADRQGVIASVAAAAALRDSSAPPDDDGPSGGAPAAPAAAVANEHGLVPLGPPPPARWPEIRAALADKRRELHIDRIAAAKAAAEALTAGGEAGVASASAAAAGAGGPDAGGSAGEETTVDPALWHCALVNRLEMRVGPGLTALPPEVGHLTALQTLILVDNGLAALPESLAALTDLRHLDVQRNALAALPAAVGRLLRLEVLNVSDNRLASLAPLGPLTTLLTLNADRNAIEEFSALNFAGLHRLETLSLSHNRLTELPEQIGELKALAVLNVSDNAITELPAGLAGLTVKKVRELRLLPNPLADKKVLKILNADRPEKVVKELFKLLEAGGGGGKKGGRR